LRIHLPFSYFLILFPIVYLATVLPISIGGIGVREGVLVYFLSQSGVPTSDAISLSFLVYMNRMISALIGGGIQLMDKRKRTLKGNISALVEASRTREVAH
jgi:glycosyltransferase 2 family protein